MLTAALDNRDDQHLQSLQTIYRVLTGSRFNCQRYGSHWEEVGFQGLWRERERHVNTWVWWKCHTECTTVQFRSFTSTHRTGSGIPQSFQPVSDEAIVGLTAPPQNDYQYKHADMFTHWDVFQVRIQPQTCEAPACWAWSNWSIFCSMTPPPSWPGTCINSPFTPPRWVKSSTLPFCEARPVNEANV